MGERLVLTVLLSCGASGTGAALSWFAGLPYVWPGALISFFTFLPIWYLALGWAARRG